MNRSISLILPYYNRKDYLKITLDSFEYFYAGRKDLQIVIVDDNSNDENRIDNLVKNYNLNIKLIRIDKKKGINPCYPINVGVRHSDGEIIVLSSPEIFHTRSMFDCSNNFELLNDSTYIQFSVFCVTDKDINSFLLTSTIDFKSKADFVNELNVEFYNNLGVGGYTYANKTGVWYTHGQLKNSCYNFLSACSKNTYYSLSGFNELFVNGTGYDDAEFRDRILKHVNNNVVWYDDFVAIHINHPSVSGDNNSNVELYNTTTVFDYKNNDQWGLL